MTATVKFTRKSENVYIGQADRGLSKTQQKAILRSAAIAFDDPVPLLPRDEANEPFIVVEAAHMPETFEVSVVEGKNGPALYKRQVDREKGIERSTRLRVGR